MSGTSISIPSYELSLLTKTQDLVELYRSGGCTSDESLYELARILKLSAISVYAKRPENTDDEAYGDIIHAVNLQQNSESHLPDTLLIQSVCTGSRLARLAEINPESSKGCTQVLLVPAGAPGNTCTMIAAMPGPEIEDQFEELSRHYTAVISLWAGALLNFMIHEAYKQSQNRYKELFQNNRAIKLMIEPETGLILQANKAACRFYGYSSKEISGMNIGNLNPMPSYKIRRSMDEVLAKKGAFFNFQHITSKGELKNVEIYSIPMEMNSKTVLYSIIHDVSDRKKIEEQLEAGENLFRQFVVNTPAAVAMFDIRLNCLMASKRWTEIQNMSDLELSGKNIKTMFDPFPEFLEIALNKGLNGESTNGHGEKLTPKGGEPEDIRWEIQPWQREKNKLGGVIVFIEFETERIRNEEMSRHLLRQKAIHNARVETIEQERKKISRELHDGLGQMITAAMLGIEMIESTLETNPEGALKQTRETKKLLDTTIHEIRNISYNLRPSALDDFGLIPALRLLCDNVNRMGKTGFLFSSYGFSGRLSPNIETTVYRICQEAINNIIRHSGATEASIQLYNRGFMLLILVQDNGCGFDTELIKKNRLKSTGLQNIRDRVEIFSGKFQIESGQNYGTELILEIPISEKENGLRNES